ncbi:MAG: hypothetical protein AAGG50_10150 [Bacteroidota bacterium]
MRFFLSLPLLVLATLAFTASALAQQLDTSIGDAPFFPDRTPLALTDAAPEGFDLFIPDDVTQALFNPARAHTLDEGFVYGTLGPSSQNNRVSATALTGGTGTRWLVVLDNAVNQLDNTQSFLDASFPDSEDERFSRNESVRTILRSSGRVVALGGRDGAGWSIGVFGGYAQLADDSEAFVERLDRFENFESRATDLRERDISTRTFGVGLEAGLSRPGWDLFGSVGYQGLRYEQGDSELSRNESREEANAPFSELLSESRDARSDGTANAVSVEGQAVIRLAPAHALFVHAEGLYGRSTTDAEASLVRRVNNELDVSDTASFDEETRTVQTTAVRVGYVFERQGEVTSVFAGVSAHARFDTKGPTRFSSATIVGSETAFLSAIDRDQTVLGLTLPLYVMLPQRTPVQVFAGGTLRYTYLREGEDRTISNTPTSFIFEESERDTSQLASSNSFALGARATVLDDFRAQVAFNGSLSGYNAWTVSLGYHF